LKGENMERGNNKPQETKGLDEDQLALREAQQRRQAFQERLAARYNQPSPLRAVIDDCIRRARPIETVELPDMKD
jgi:hypothetical protein